MKGQVTRVEVTMCVRPGCVHNLGTSCLLPKTLVLMSSCGECHRKHPICLDVRKGKACLDVKKQEELAQLTSSIYNVVRRIMTEQRRPKPPL